MSIWILLYASIAAPAALIGLAVAVIGLPEAPSYSPPAAPPTPALRAERRRLVRPAPAPVPAFADEPGGPGSPIYYRLAAAAWLREISQRQAVTR